jgi:predicted nucleic acid-binding protein
MLVVDASCLYEVVADGRFAEDVRRRLAADPELAVVSIIRRDHQLGRLDDTAAGQAVDDLREWPGERYGHQPLLDRVWTLRQTVRGWDAAYVALAEALGATVLTLDTRLAAAPGPRCPFDVIV